MNATIGVVLPKSVSGGCSCDTIANNHITSVVRCQMPGLLFVLLFSMALDGGLLLTQCLCSTLIKKSCCEYVRKRQVSPYFGQVSSNESHYQSLTGHNSSILTSETPEDKTGKELLQQIFDL